MAFVTSLSAVSCKDSQKASIEQASAHVTKLAELARADVAEIRNGLPGAEAHLQAVFASPTPPRDNLEEVRGAVLRARDKVADLRVAKSTFFALVDPSGVVLRNDQDQDLMAGANLFQAFPELKRALDGQYVETRGSMPEASGVKGRADAQWAAAQPVRVEGAVKGLYVTGWSLSAYAYRLEFYLRGQLRAQIAGTQEKLPLVYVYVITGDQVYGAPVSPEVNAEAIRKLAPLSKVQGEAVFTAAVEITDRDFGLAVKATPALGPQTGVAVLRSET